MCTKGDTMTNSMKEIIATAEEAEKIFITSGVQRRDIEETHLAQKKISIEFFKNG